MWHRLSVDVLMNDASLQLYGVFWFWLQNEILDLFLKFELWSLLEKTKRLLCSLYFSAGL